MTFALSSSALAFCTLSSCPQLAQLSSTTHLRNIAHVQPTLAAASAPRAQATAVARAAAVFARTIPKFRHRLFPTFRFCVKILISCPLYRGSLKFVDCIFCAKNINQSDSL